ncbi:hypothetical protein [Bradyrhizobium lablabi]|uniref:hypothetical protein n=1 Tax=Bradyrhizobium lablabi TaxID=722472 RepID=UPI001BAC5C95|nr:hypothetical protein [Bradyrhizobium lablabi]MBR0692584.1 hypothetical protein [Bradyrhizobium lablabi]
MRRPYGFFRVRRRVALPPDEGTAMRIGMTSLRGVAASLVLPLIAIAGIAAWLMLPEPSDADDQTAASSSAETVLLAQSAPTPGAATDMQPSPAVGTAPAAVAVPSDEPATVGIAATQEASPEVRSEKSPRDGLWISSQSFRRGGLGSKALVTLTLRNTNDFAVRDIEIACAFVRSDGSHLTDRKRLIADTIGMRSRKTYPGMLIGFVNVNANKAKCTVVTANRI